MSDSVKKTIDKTSVIDLYVSNLYTYDLYMYWLCQGYIWLHSKNFFVKIKFSLFQIINQWCE